MPNKENLEMSLSNDENLRRRREMITKAKSKSLNPCDNSNDEEPTAEDDNEVSRPNSDKKGRYKSQKLKMKIKRQASLEEQFPISAAVKTEEIVGSEKETATVSEDSTKKPAEKKHQFLEELKVPKIEIMRKNGIDDGIKVKEYAILSPNSSKLRERFSKSKFLKQDSKNLNVELSKSSDSGIGVSRSTEDDPLKSSESVIFRFFDIGPDTRLNKSDSERSPNFLDTVSLFTRSRSHERSVSSDSSDKNLSDMDKPSIKIRKRHEYSESRDSSSSYEGNIFDAHISNRVRKLHEVALKQMSEESAKKMEAQKRSVEFKYPVEFGSYDSIQRKTPPLSKVRKFKSLERTDSSNRTTGESMEDDDQNSGSEGLSKAKSRLKKQDRFVKRLSLKDKRISVNRDLGITGKKEKRCRGFLKSWKDTGEDESDENMDMVDGWQEKDSKAKEEQSKRLSRKDKKSSKKTKRALSEEHRGSRRERSLLFAMTGGKKRSDSETRNGRVRKEYSEEEPTEESEVSEKAEDMGTGFSVKSEPKHFREIQKNLNPPWVMPRKIFSMQKHRNDVSTSKLDVDRSRTSLDFVEIGSYLEVVGKIWPLSDDYKIVFISSDSSTKENRSISTDSDTGSAESGSDSFRNVKKLASDCDWDYFDSSSIVRPVMKDWNWHGSPRGFSGTFRERSSPVFSTSDDNSPKFPRRSLNRFSVRDSPISCDTDVSGFSPNLQRKIMDIDENKFRAAESPKSVDVNDESHAEEKEIEITDLKVSPPIKSKELHMIKENVNQKMEIQSFTNSDIKPEETKKSKKRRKNKKTNKGSLKDDEIMENLNESKDMPATEKNDGTQTGMISELEENMTEKEPAALGLLKHNLVSSTEKKETEELTASGSNLSPDGVNPIAGSVDGTEPKTAVVQAGEDQKESPTKGKGKSKKQKNKKRCEKCSTVDPKSDGLSGGNVTNESAGADSSEKLGDLVANEYTFPTGSFGYQPQNLISAQTLNPGVLTYNCPVSNVLENANVFKNFVPIPVPVLIPVPFPVPTAIWSQNYQNFTIPNLNLGTENIDMLKNFQNICAANYMNQARNETKEVSFGATENNSSGTGSGSIHIRAINMQRPALAMGPLPSCSQGSVNSAESDLTCLTSSEHQLVDNDKTRLPADSVEKSDCSQEVVIDGVGKVVNSKKTKKGKKKYKKLTLHDDLVDVTKEEDEKNEIMANGVDSSGCPPVEKCDLNVPNIFVERKTFREVKNLLKHKNDLAQETSRAPSEQIGIDTNDNVSQTVNLNGFQNVIVIDDTINCEDIDSSLLKIDRKSDYSSTSHSDDSDENLPSRKPFKKSYYFNRRDSEEKTSGDSDIADVNSSEEETKTDNSSQGNSSASEDEGNPDSSRFSEVYVVNPLDGDEPLKKLKSSEWSKDSSKGSKQSKKLKEMLPLKNFPVSDGTDSDSEGQESSVVLLKHVKKLPEDDLDIQVERNNFEEQAEVNTEPLEIEDNCSTSAEPDNEIVRTTKEPEHLPKQQEAGVAVPVSQYEDPVSLVPELIKPESRSASVAESELVPGSVHEVLFNSNNSEPVSSEINSVPFQSFENKIGASSSALENANGTRLKVSGNESSNKSAEPTRYLRDGDVNYNADSEVTKSDLLKEILATHFTGPVDVVGGDTGKNSSDGNSLSDHISTKGNENGPSLLDTIENRIRHFSQLDNFNVPPRRNEAKYTSLIMITPDKNGKSKSENNLVSGDSVKVITTNTTKVWNKDNAKQLNDDIFLKHTNRKNEDEESGGVHKLKSLEDYYTMTLENSRGLTISPKKPNVIKNMTPLKEEDEGETQLKEEVQVVTDGKTLSAVICLEEGLADDDSWVEDLEKDRENDFVAAVTEEDSSSGDETHIGACIPVHTDREEELRGYHRGAINFTLHTIVEESCEDSEVEDKTKLTVTKKRPTSVTELEKYFYFDIGGGVTPNFESKDVDTFSESSSSIYSDGGVIDETGGEVRENSDQNQLSTSMLEKYFLNFDRDGREKESDGSVGSDSEGPPSPEQRRKRLFRARASNRLHSNSLDNLVQSENEQQSVDMVLDSEDSSTETDIPESQMVDKSDDSVKRKKKRKISGGSLNVPLTMQDPDKKVNADGEVGKEIRDSLSREHFRELKEEMRDHEVDEIKNGNLDHESDDERSKTPQPEFLLESGLNRDKQQSRDSGFIGSCDDLLKDQKTGGDSSGSDTKKKSTDKSEKKSNDAKEVENPGATINRQPIAGMKGSTPPATGLTRKDSFNNWSSDEETNLMMSKMRQFFKAMVSVPKNSNKMPDNSNPSSPQVRTKGVKSPQLVYFENELTRLMKTVPGIRDDQVREIVEYLSSEDTWSDSYDSSDYTSSDLEGTAAYYQRTQLQQEISESCKQIIDKFDQSKSSQEQKPKVPPRRNSSPMNRETALVYQKLVASFNKITNENENPTSSPHSSPPLFAKVMHHIGSRLVALMHEVSSNSSGEGSISSHKSRYHKRISQKLSNVSSTTEEECGLTDESDCKASDTTNLLGQNMPYFHLLHQLPRSKSHDLLLEEAKVKSLRSSSSGVSDILEEKEASDYERFSWRGSFESALMADSRSKLTLLSNDSHSSNTTLAAKRRSAGDLLFLKSLSRDQLDRVRSCGSIGGVSMEDKNIWTTGRERNGRRRSSVPDATSPGSGASADGDEDSSDSEIIQERSITLPRSLQSVASSQNTNSLPRLPTTGATNTQNLSKAQSVQHFLPNAKSARYRPPGFSRMQASSPKRAVSAPGLQVLQPSHARRDRRRNQNYLAGNTSLSGDELNNSETTSPHIHGGSKSASPSPIVGSAKSRLRRGPSSIGSPDWSAPDEIQRLVALDQQRQSNSSLGARSDSMASVYSGAGEGRSCSIPVRGEVEFGLQYNYKAGDLEIYVKQCKDLAAVDTKRNRSDPYVKVYLLPDKSKSGKRKTKVKKHTLNPIFDEVLKFHISLNGLETRTLWLTVWHSDMFGRNDFLGEVMMSLENKVFDDPTPQSYTLQERTEPFEDVLSYKGEIIIGLKFVPPDANTLQKKGKRSKGTLNVKVKEAKNLTGIKGNGVSDPFCKSYLLPDKGRNSKQKTPVQRRTCNPSWNHTFVYEDVSLQDLSERCLELTVWDHDRLASNEFLGGLRFSLGSGRHNGKSVDWMDSAGKEVSLWQSMLEKPNLWVEGCLPLRASLDPPNSLT